MALLREWLVYCTEFSVTIIDALALVIIVYGTIEAFINGLRVLLSSASGHEQRDVWLRYARFLVAGLTFQLAADIVETAVTPSWDDIGKLAVIALIRTFLNYFLERDLGDIRERDRENPREKARSR